MCRCVDLCVGSCVDGCISKCGVVCLRVCTQVCVYVWCVYALCNIIHKVDSTLSNDTSYGAVSRALPLSVYNTCDSNNNNESINNNSSNNNISNNYAGHAAMRIPRSSVLSHPPPLSPDLTCSQLLTRHVSDSPATADVRAYNKIINSSETMLFKEMPFIYIYIKWNISHTKYKYIAFRMSSFICKIQKSIKMQKVSWYILCYFMFPWYGKCRFD